MAAQLPDEPYRREAGVYFKSLHGTLNHLLTADRIWMRRIEGTGEHPATLNAIVFADLAALRKAREAEDERILKFVEALRRSGNSRRRATTRPSTAPPSASRSRKSSPTCSTTRPTTAARRTPPSPRSALRNRGRWTS